MTTNTRIGRSFPSDKDKKSKLAKTPDKFTISDKEALVFMSDIESIHDDIVKNLDLAKQMAKGKDNEKSVQYFIGLSEKLNEMMLEKVKTFIKTCKKENKI